MQNGNKPINKKELARRVSLRAGATIQDTNQIIGILVDEIQNAVAAGDKVGIAGFGTFEPRHRAERTARNPRTGEVKPVEARTVPTFRVGAPFRTLVIEAEGARRAQRD